MIQRGQVVAELVRQQDGQQRQRERQALEQDRRDGARTQAYSEKAALDIERQVAVEIVLHGRAHHGGGRAG